MPALIPIKSAVDDTKPPDILLSKTVPSLFHGNELMLREVNKHQKIQWYSCEWCDRVFAKRYLLKNHQRTHSNDRPYSCDVILSQQHKIFCILTTFQILTVGVW